MERICKNCKWVCEVDHGYYCCELDYESVTEKNSCDMFENDDARNFIKNKRKDRYYQ